MIWRPVTAGLGTLIEVQERWSIDDLADAHEALDVQREVDEDAAERACRDQD